MTTPSKHNNRRRASTEESTRLSSCYTPIKSPSSQSLGKKQGNLTGTARKIKDAAADLHNINLKWTKLNAEGASIINQIANIRLEALAKTDDEGDITDISKDPHDKFPSSLEPLLHSLDSVCLQMEKIVDKQRRLATMLKSLRELEQYQTSKGTCQTDPVVFWTWTLQQFETTVEDLYQIYRKEVKLKRAILENICHIEERNTIMFYTASWLHEPYIGKEACILRESMLIETGHKSP